MNYVQGGINAASTVYEGYQRAADLETAAKQYEQNAGTARRQGNADEDRERFDMALKLGSQRAAIGASGFDSSSASFDTLQMQSKGQLELNALTTRYKAELSALDWENQRDGANAAASRTRHQANIQKIAGFLGGTFGGGSSSYHDTSSSTNRYGDGSYSGETVDSSELTDGAGATGGSYWGT
jgi:hypothetical protein